MSDRQAMEMEIIPTTTQDQSILLTESKYMAKRSYVFYDNKHYPTYLSIFKILPEYFSEKSIKTIKK